MVLYHSLSPSHPSPSLHRVPLSQPCPRPPIHSLLFFPPLSCLFSSLPSSAQLHPPEAGQQGLGGSQGLLGCEWLRHLRDFLQERPAMSHWGWRHLDRKGAGGLSSCLHLLILTPLFLMAGSPFFLLFVCLSLLLQNHLPSPWTWTPSFPPHSRHHP